MNSALTRFVQTLVTDCLAKIPAGTTTAAGDQLVFPAAHAQQYRLNLTPFEAQAQPADAASYFSGIKSLAALIAAYWQACQAKALEQDVPAAMANVHSYAGIFHQHIINSAAQKCSDRDAVFIAELVKNLDIYTAVKAVESLLYSSADLRFLSVCHTQGWDVHFDHIAIRCGRADRRDAERIVDLLVQQHAYTASQIPAERFYTFPDGWNAYPLYKILDNGQVLRIFVDQSDGMEVAQIIQHWNYVYGYTAHHLALRASRLENGMRVAVPLQEMMAALAQQDITCLTPTGEYSQGLLLQVFTKPELNHAIPEVILTQLRDIDVSLGEKIHNAKLLEIVSRREGSGALAQDYFGLYGIRYEWQNPLHSFPIYQYFLPGQAAHVIQTSVQV